MLMPSDATPEQQGTALSTRRTRSTAPAFGDLLRRYRTEANLTQTELAERAGLSPRGVSDLERGARANPRPATVRLLADALGLTETDRAAFLAAAVHSTASPIPHSGPVDPAVEAPSATTLTSPSPPTPHLSLPTGTVTFLFTDIEGSTQLLQRLGDAYANVLTAHQRLLRAAFAAHSGVEVDTQGDSFFVAFPTAPAALAAAAEATHALAGHPWPKGATLRVRIGLHTGAPQLVGDHYIGLDVHRAARIAAAGHGGQVLLSETTRALAHQHTLPAGTTLRAMGAHRLKDLQEPEPLYQLVLDGLPTEFPPLKTLDTYQHNLPLQPTPLLGREEQVATLTTLLRREDMRLVTLTGPGGIGKTRLSVQVAAELVEDFADGVWFVRLSRLTDPALVIPTIAQTLGLREQGSQPLAETLRAHVTGKRLLLVLDNFEQVVGAAGEVAALLAAGLGLKALVTSRTPLHLRGEREYALSPLLLPEPGRLPPERLGQYAAVAMFVERAQAARADFVVTAANAPAITEICARLDGLPLAIELAAARIKLLPPEALLGRLVSQLTLLTGGARDLEERQQTMRTTLNWSYDLLPPQEQRLFRRLAVFAGGCTLEAAEAVCMAPEGVEPLEVDTLEGVSVLVDQSLAKQREEAGQARFLMLHVIREYALEQLEQSGEAEALLRAHADYYLTLAERAQPGLEGTLEAGWLMRLDHDIDNLRTALTWARERRDVALGLQLACAWSEVWYMRGSLREGRGWVEQLLALAPKEAASEGTVVPNRLQARALHWAAFFAYWQGDYDAAIARWQASLTLARLENDALLTVQALKRLAVIASFRGKSEQVDAYFEESLTLAHTHGDAQTIASVLGSIGAEAYFRGDYLAAVARTERALQLQRDADLPASYVTAVWLDTLARTAVRQGDLARATALECEALAIWHDVGALARFPEVLEVLAMRDCAVGEGMRAARLLGAAETLRTAVGAPLSPEMRADITDIVAPVRAALGEEQWAVAFAAGQTLTLEAAIAEALDEAGENG